MFNFKLKPGYNLNLINISLRKTMCQSYILTTFKTMQHFLSSAVQQTFDFFTQKRQQTVNRIMTRLHDARPAQTEHMHLAIHPTQMQITRVHQTELCNKAIVVIRADDQLNARRLFLVFVVIFTTIRRPAWCDTRGNKLVIGGLFRPGRSYVRPI